ncbi:hypothetical protein GP2143_04318 [marine gamma proteobacterium HTCC2143]|uniref:Uncharacterized protein n=1 Tax=marine gamma proteobacterium HTCC2143 TaxID=247633 RepID=A0YHP2_9GAMM|nr:hypothetical protein GP2143_04318 [marine gamma proteobacterium HTCC2143]
MLRRACGSSRDKGVNLLSLVHLDQLILNNIVLGNITVW